MANVDFFKQQAKHFLKDYETKTYNDDEGCYEFHPRYFEDIEFLLNFFNIDFVYECEDDEKDTYFTLMKAQHIVARLSGFYKWNELIKASEPMLEIGKLLLLNRASYQKAQGYFSNIVDSIIVYDWKEYERENLNGFDDAAKLEIFKNEFLSNDTSKRTSIKVTLDFSDDIKAQDMVNTVMQETGSISPERSILSSIIPPNHHAILQTGWAGEAVTWWGHFDYMREFKNLENPIIEITLNREKARMLNAVIKQEKVSLCDAVLYHMIFQLENYGYHI